MKKINIEALKKISPAIKSSIEGYENWIAICQGDIIPPDIGTLYTGNGCKDTPIKVGSVIEWDDYWVETNRPNFLCDHRILTGEVVMLYPSWCNYEFRIKILSAPDGDPIKVGDTIYRSDGKFYGCKVFKRLS